MNKNISNGLNIPIILGTARKGRQSEKVSNFMLDEVKKFNIKTEIIDVRDYRLKATDAAQKSPMSQKFAEKINSSDGLIIVSPEYNHSYPGELKMMLDMAYLQYSRKPIGFCGVSAGLLGGARAIEQLRLIMIELHMIPIREALYFPMVQELFDESDNIKNSEAYEKRIESFMGELLWYAKKLKTAND